MSGLFNDYQKKLRRLGEFLSEKYANISSLLHLDIENAKEEWFDWLRYRGFKTHRLSYNAARGKTYKCMTSLASTLNVIYTNLFHLTDTREEWEKDIWDVRVLNEKYNIDYNKSKTVYTLNFTTIKNKIIREQVKKYFKQRLLSKRNFSWSTATNYLYYIPRFINLILFLEPKWKDFQDLSREHIEKYIEDLNNYAKTQIKQGKSHPEHYISKGINIIQKFLEDLQTFEYSIACQKNIRLLILPSDKPKLKKRPYDHIDYIPDTVLEQLFRDINHLHRDAQPILWIAFKTGLRISDVLGLKQDCLVRLNGKYQVVADIKKTYVKGHSIPIDDELANIIAALVDNSKVNSNQDNNPEKYIFARLSGARKGRPYSQKWFVDQLKYFCQRMQYYK